MHATRVIALVALFLLFVVTLVGGNFARHDIALASQTGHPVKMEPVDVYGICCCLMGASFGLLMWVCDRRWDKDQIQ